MCQYQRSGGITDVPGVRVGHATIDDGAIQTGVTVLFPIEGNVFQHKLPAACHVINGFGKTAGLVQIEELGELESPIVLTNTLSVGAMQTALVRYTIETCAKDGIEVRSFNPVVAECNDSKLNDIRALAVGEKEFREAVASAGKEFARGSVGAGRGMICHGYKGGIGSASKQFVIGDVTYTLGVLVLANHGTKRQLRLSGVSSDDQASKPEEGSIILVVATDLPCDARQLKRIAKRVAGGMARVGSEFGHGSGDIAIAFSTAYAPAYSQYDAGDDVYVTQTRVCDSKLDPAFSAAVRASEAAIWDALYSATTVGDVISLSEALGIVPNSLRCSKKTVSLPRKVRLANLPTRIDCYQERMTDYPLPEGVRLWIKRDDQTGSDCAGNKIRKLEYALAEAIDQGCDTVISTGGIQSNHCRATAAAAAKLGLRCHLMLRTDRPVVPEGNHLLDELYGATIHYITPDHYQHHLLETMKELSVRLERQGARPYWIPTGASNGIGTFGYVEALDEIVRQERELGVVFDTVVCAVGSGGTYTGLVLANHIKQLGKRIVGFAVASNAEQFRAKVHAIAAEFSAYLGQPIALSDDEINIVDSTVGLGYAQSTAEERAFIRAFAQKEGIVFDPVYTGKALRGLMQELSTGGTSLAGARNVLFIHTGGLYGLLCSRFSDMFDRDGK